MKAKTELFLYLLSWHVDGAFSASLRRSLEKENSFETWVYRNGLSKQIARLEQQALLERLEDAEKGDRVYRLTELGRVAARGGENPHEQWNRNWDGTWRIVAFDLPEFKHAVREKWRRELRRLKFGCLQGSVWVSPDPVDGIKRALEGAAVHTQRLIFIEGRPAAGESDSEIVDAAWNFERIGQLYDQHKRTLDRLNSSAANKPVSRPWLLEWAKEEHAAWKAILKADPFLPTELLPNKYPGVRGLKLRDTALKRAAKMAKQIS